MPQRATPSLLKGRLLCEFSTAGIPKTRFPILDTMPEAFVLFKTEPTHERDVYLSLTEHADVAEVHALYGEFDLLVRISSQHRGTFQTVDAILPENRGCSGNADPDCSGGLNMAIGFVLMTTFPDKKTPFVKHSARWIWSPTIGCYSVSTTSSPVFKPTKNTP